MRDNEKWTGTVQQCSGPDGTVLGTLYEEGCAALDVILILIFYILVPVPVSTQTPMVNIHITQHCYTVSHKNSCLVISEKYYRPA